ncbi:MAG: hypothetical protein WD076_03890 [Parvularculaceae bacterium]
MKKIIAGLLGAGLVLGMAPAFAGEWRLDSRRCADLREDRYDRREDRRDERVDYGRRDRVEDRYDRRENRWDRSITICPRSAFFYVPDRREQAYGERNGNGRGYARGRYRTPPLTLSYDRRLRMSYRYDHGRKIYVRG